MRGLQLSTSPSEINSYALWSINIVQQTASSGGGEVVCCSAAAAVTSAIILVLCPRGAPGVPQHPLCWLSMGMSLAPSSSPWSRARPRALLAPTCISIPF